MNIEDTLESLPLDSDERKVSYGMGWQFGRHLSTHNFEGLDMDAAFTGVLDSFYGRNSPLTDEQVEAAFKVITDKVEQQRQEAAFQQEGQSQAFMAENTLKQGVITTASGLQYKIIETGEGEVASPLDIVTAHYHGMLINGYVFDSSVEKGEPAEFPVQSVIKGWTEVLQIMPEGSKWRVYVPAELAYGAKGKTPNIPGNSALIFDLELLKVNKP